MPFKKGCTWLTKGRPDLTDADYLKKLLGKCVVMPNGCWEFQGFTAKTSGDPRTRGYGHIDIKMTRKTYDRNRRRVQPLR